MKICKINGCGRKHLSKGYCSKHYQQVRKHGKILKRTIKDPNEIIIKGSIAEIILYNNKCKEVARAIVDAEDVEKVRGHKWYLTQGYVQAMLNGKPVGIQHIVMGVTPRNQQPVDHRNGNPLYNNKSNLRVCFHKENIRNAEKRKNNTSGFKGVFWNRINKNWFSQIMVNYKTIYLGSFKEKIDAAKAYNDGAVKYHGEFARLNDA